MAEATGRHPGVKPLENDGELASFQKRRYYSSLKRP